MCIPIQSDVSHGNRGRKHPSSHDCIFKILSCSPKQLCVFCFLFCYFAVGNCLQSSNNDFYLHETEPKPPNQEVRCSNGTCYLKILSNEKALEHMVTAGARLFDDYANKSTQTMSEEGLERLISDIGLMADSHEGHAHEHHEIDEEHDHEAHENHEGHDHSHEYDYDDYVDYFTNLFGDVDSNETEDDTSRRKRSADNVPCISSAKELVKEYFSPRPSEKASLTLADFITLLPQLLLNMKPGCKTEKETFKSNKETTEPSAAAVWGISFGVVMIISLVSLLGVLLIPFLRNSSILNQLIAFLVALAVGTLSGDALLHLLPHANGDHDHGKGHEGHDHGEEEKDHFASMWKGLVACAGIYTFYLLETVMGMIHRKKAHKKPGHRQNHNCENGSSPTSSPSKDPKSNKDDVTVTYSPTPSQSPLLNNGCVPSAGVTNTTKAICESSAVPLINVNGVVPVKHRHENGGPKTVIQMDEEPLDTGHHHHHHDVPQTIANLAWMVIVGDGLHNITDGLAIGAAFTSGVGPGLGTSLAIFFHEIPQELGDFAILLNAGMSVKQALLCNFLSALLCFVGLIIGLILGEYTNGIILWILAFTAGGFLYIALVDMLPAMIKQLEHKDFLKRFLIQNAGLLCGFAIMIVIALREESFTFNL